MNCFGGVDNYLSTVKAVDCFNYVYRPVGTYSPPAVPDEINIISSTSINSSTPSREWYAYGMNQQTGDAVIYGGDLGGSPSNLVYYFSQSKQTLVNQNSTLQGAQTQVSNHFTFGSTGCCGVVVPSSNILYICVGTADIIDLNFCTAYYYLTAQFVQLNFSGAQAAFPNRQYGSIMNYVGNYNGNGPCLWVFGGKTRPPGGNYTSINTVFVLQISTGTWLTITQPTGGPSPRSFAAGAVLTDAISWVIFGGKNDDNPNAQIDYNDLNTLNMQTGVWSLVTPGGTGPGGRDSLSACSLQWSGENSILYYGGSDDTGAALSDFYKYEYQTAGYSPTPPPFIPGLELSESGKNTGTGSAPVNATTAASSVAPLVKESSANNLLSWLDLFL